MKQPRPPSKTTTAYIFQAWFSVNTIHGNRLEFVLDEADNRAQRTPKHILQPQGRVFTSYSDALFEMLKKEFKAVKNGIYVREMNEYGDVSIQIEASSPAALQRALVRCEKVTQRWVNKYRVNEMLPEKAV